MNAQDVKTIDQKDVDQINKAMDEQNKEQRGRFLREQLESTAKNLNSLKELRTQLRKLIVSIDDSRIKALTVAIEDMHKKHCEISKKISDSY